MANFLKSFVFILIFVNLTPAEVVTPKWKELGLKHYKQIFQSIELTPSQKKILGGEYLKINCNSDSSMNGYLRELNSIALSWDKKQKSFDLNVYSLLNNWIEVCAFEDKIVRSGFRGLVSSLKGLRRTKVTRSSIDYLKYKMKVKSLYLPFRDLVQMDLDEEFKIELKVYLEGEIERRSLVSFDDTLRLAYLGSEKYKQILSKRFETVLANLNYGVTDPMFKNPQFYDYLWVLAQDSTSQLDSLLIKNPCFKIDEVNIVWDELISDSLDVLKDSYIEYRPMSNKSGLFRLDGKKKDVKILKFIEGGHKMYRYRDLFKRNENRFHLETCFNTLFFNAMSKNCTEHSCETLPYNRRGVLHGNKYLKLPERVANRCQVYKDSIVKSKYLPLGRSRVVDGVSMNPSKLISRHNSKYTQKGRRQLLVDSTHSAFSTWYFKGLKNGVKPIQSKLPFFKLTPVMPIADDLRLSCEEFIVR